MALQNKKFLDAAGITHLVGLLDEYPNNQVLGTVIDAIEGELEQKAEKSEIPNVPVQDVQVNGVSVLQDGVANIPVGSSNTFGVFKTSTIYGIQQDNGILKTKKATIDIIKAGNDSYNPITTSVQHESTFYGLAKAAGDVTQSQSSNAVGTYTDEAKAAIQQMLDVPSTSDMSTYATKVDTVLDTTLSLGRLANSDVGENSVALGYDVTASGYSAFAEGYETAATSDSAHAEGENTQATDSAAHAEGTYTQANGYASHAEGDNTIAEGYFAHAEGTETTATGLATHVFGERNFNCNEGTDVSLRGTMVEIVGNGQENVYSNARALTWTGDEYLAGNLYVNANGTSTSGTRVATVTEIPEVPVQDVQVNGTSVVTDGIANLPVVTANGSVPLGLVKPQAGLGTAVASNGGLAVVKAETSSIKNGADEYRPIVPQRQHESVFYGLAKASGDTTQSASSNAVGTYTDSAKAAIKNMLGITQTLTVTVLTQDNVTVTGQTVTVRAVDSTGPIFATAAYEGQPVAFAMPSGFAYHVSVSDTLDHHFNPTTASGVITNTDVSVTLQYSDFSTIRTAADIKAALNANLDLTDLVGEQITCTKNGDTLAWDVVDYDSTTGRIKLLLHDAFGTANMVFEPAQALMWCENGLAAGSYTFADGSTHYYFTLASAIPAGGQLRADPSSFWTYASQDATATLETGTVSTTEITGATDLGTCGQGLLNNFSRNRYGSNNQAESAIQWWLNSDAPANTLRTPVTKFSRAYSYNVPGFMNGLDQDFINCLDDVDWFCSTNNVYECPEELGGYTKGIRQTYTIKSKFCFASEMEIFGSYGGNPDGSTIFDLYNGADADDRKKYRGTSVQVWWLRSPSWSSASSGRVVYSSGGAVGNGASSSYAVVPACQVSRDSEVTE